LPCIPIWLTLVLGILHRTDTVEDPGGFAEVLGPDDQPCAVANRTRLPTPFRQPLRDLIDAVVTPERFAVYDKVG
jgi:hypothetical protein